jgi:enoyl-CoA hydratase/carnithine racemase
VRRRAALGRHRFTPLEALKAGVVDRLANLTGTGVGNGTEKVLEEAMTLAKEVKELTSQNVWGVIKFVISYLELTISLMRKLADASGGCIF